MLLAKVIGTMNATLKHPALVGQKILLVQPLSEQLMPKGIPFLAIDTVQAGIGSITLVSREGGSARISLGNDHAPVHAVILGIVDSSGERTVS
ncbi:MAG: EutN/CcmL family microcompartment protein [Cyanobacteria bacterium NC_groundwater_1444_Ag_S-0.65um_54_12]|nr:EutN/CcmL family microcompartment protein [Cyanobacteria bacterium NC_groundwater_1444_Ag_S-0.65um_54_12]